MSIIKAGGRDFWAEAYQLAKQIEAKETNKIHQTNKNIKQNRIQQRAEEKALEKQAIRSDMLINDLSLQSINDSLPPIKSTYETAEKPSFKTNTLNTPAADNRQFYPIPPSYLANSTLNKDVKIGAKENNDLSLYPKYFPTSATQHSKAPFTTLDAQIRSAALNNLTADGGLGITTTLPYSSLLSDIPSTIPVLNSKKGKSLLKGIGLALALSTGLLGGLNHTGLVGKNIFTSGQHVTDTKHIAQDAVTDSLERAAINAGFIKDPSAFTSDVRKIAELPDIVLPAELEGKTKEQLTPKQNKLRLKLQNQANLDAYKSGSEEQYINRFDYLGRVLDAEGNLNKNFILGAQKYAPNFAKKHGLDAYQDTNKTGKLDSVNTDLQKLFTESVANFKGNTPRVSEGNRTAEYQHNLYLKDRFKDGKFHDIKGAPTTYADGYFAPSDHQNANAIDVVIPGKAQNRRTGADKVYGNFNDIMQATNKRLFGDKYELEWGGTFANDDFGHFALLPNKHKTGMTVEDAVKTSPSKINDPCIATIHVGSGYSNNELGHTALSVTCDDKTRLYDFGRYGKITPMDVGPVTLKGNLSPTGEGILNVWNNVDEYLKHEASYGAGTNNRRTTSNYSYDINRKQADNVFKHFDKLIAEGTPYKKPTTVVSSFKLKQGYNAMTNNCVTVSLDGFKQANPKAGVSGAQFIDVDKAIKDSKLMKLGLATQDKPTQLFLPGNLRDYLESKLDIQYNKVTNK